MPLPGNEAAADRSVSIVGGGPTGLMLAAELAIAGVDVVVVERRTDQHVDGSRAGGLLPRSIEVLDQRGVADRFLNAGHTVPAHGFAGIPMDISDLPTRHNYVLALRQSDFEPILADWVLGDLGVPVERGRKAIGVVQHEEGVDLELDDGRILRSLYVVGCDGGRSLVRDAAGIGYVGAEPTRSWIVAEADTAEEPPVGVRYDEAGMHGAGRIGEHGPVRFVSTEQALRSGPPTIDELRECLVGVFGTDLGVHSPRWMSRFNDAARLATTYRDRRVLLAGDAAHIHPPHGGQGLNTGLQDAVNLGWRLADATTGRSPDTLLDSYGAERRPVAARVLHNTLAQVALTSGGARAQALRDITAQLLASDASRIPLAAMLCALDVAYDLGADEVAHPLVGRRMPDIDLQPSGEQSRLFEALVPARPILVTFGPHARNDLADGARPVHVVQAARQEALELPVLGTVTSPPAALVRPDGHVAWTGEPTEQNLFRALSALATPSLDDADPAQEHR